MPLIDGIAQVFGATVWEGIQVAWTPPTPYAPLVVVPAVPPWGTFDADPSLYEVGDENGADLLPGVE